MLRTTSRFILKQLDYELDEISMCDSCLGCSLSQLSASNENLELII